MVDCEKKRKKLRNVEKNMGELEILYEDEALLVCKKPAGVATQTKRLGQKDMESLLKNYRASKGEVPYIGVVHRLDQPVSGVMVFAKTKEAASDLSRQVKTKLADKYYFAMTEGVPEKKKAAVGVRGIRMAEDDAVEHAYLLASRMDYTITYHDKEISLTAKIKLAKRDTKGTKIRV